VIGNTVRGAVDLDNLGLGGLSTDQGDTGNGQGGNELGILEHGVTPAQGWTDYAVQITHRLLQPNDRL
jgi:hypothetical protein